MFNSDMAMRKIQYLVRRHEEWRLKKCINLIPSENVTSSAVRRILSSDLGHRYTLRKEEAPDFPMPFKNYYCGTKYIDEIEETGRKLACEIFNAKHAFLQPLSGHISAMIMLASTCERGDRILCISGENGGYPGYLPGFASKYFDLKVDFLPFDKNEFNLDYEKCEEKILKLRPKLVILGASCILFPYDVKRIKESCEKVDSYLGYDASHVLGLIAGGKFQPNPLREGVDILVGSTHKTFFGPQGGMILTNDDEVAGSVLRNMKLKMVDNPHLNRIAALAQALWEFLRFGKEYAEQVVKNAKSLGKHLEEEGVPVKYGEKGYTESHQLLVDKGEVEKKVKKKYSEVAEVLEKANIIVDRDGRIGVQEVTRFGMKEREMEEIADLFSKVVIRELSPVKVRQAVVKFRKRFLRIKYY